MSLRIIAGRWRQRRLAAPPGHSTRPMPDRLKQSLFDWLGQTCAGLRVVDCCAGSGSLGFEAASREAAQVYLIEQDKAALAALADNHRMLGHPATAQILSGDLERLLPGLSAIDLVFADPPFPWYQQDRPRLDRLLGLIAGILSPQGRVFIRGERGTDLPIPPSGLVEADRRSYGRSWIALLRPTGTVVVHKQQTAGE